MYTDVSALLHMARNRLLTLSLLVHMQVMLHIVPNTLRAYNTYIVTCRSP
jgi:hypothetical protein